MEIKKIKIKIKIKKIMMIFCYFNKLINPLINNKKKYYLKSINFI